MRPAGAFTLSAGCAFKNRGNCDCTKRPVPVSWKNRLRDRAMSTPPYIHPSRGWAPHWPRRRAVSAGPHSHAAKLNYTSTRPDALDYLYPSELMRIMPRRYPHWQSANNTNLQPRGPQLANQAVQTCTCSEHCSAVLISGIRGRSGKRQSCATRS